MLKIFGCKNDSASEEVESVVNQVPNVKDEEISESIYSEEEWHYSEANWTSETTYDRGMQLQLYDIITAQLNE